MGRLRRKNYLFVWYISDHPPPHVHVYRNGKAIGKFNLIDESPIKGVFSKKLILLIRELKQEGVFNEII